MMFFIAACFAAAANALPSGELLAAQYRNVVVISDIHGDDMAFIRSLWIGYCKTIPEATPCPVSFADLRSLFDKALAGEALPDNVPLYKGGDTALVQMGDFLDRGPFGKRAISIFHQVSRIIGWHVLNLLGNHELIAMLNQDTYNMLIHKDDDIKRPEEITRGGSLYELLLESSLFMVRLNRPAGMEPFSYNDPSALFVHAGISEDWFEDKYRGFKESSAVVNVQAVNENLYRLLKKGDPDTLDRLLDHRSLLMSRSTADHRNEEEACSELYDMLYKFDVARVIVGHTPQVPHRRMATRCRGRFILTDIAMSRFFEQKDPSKLDGAHPHAMIIHLSPAGALESIKTFYTPSIADDAIFGGNIVLPSAKVLEQIQAHRAQHEVIADDQVQKILAEKDALEEHGDDKENDSPRNGPALRKKRKHEEDIQLRASRHIVYSDSDSEIRRAALGESQGFVITYARPDGPIAGLPQAIKNHYGTPGIKFVRRSSRRSTFFLETNNIDPLEDYEAFGYTLAAQLVDIVSAFHDGGICIGFEPVSEDFSDDQERWIKSFFTVDETGNALSLINMSRVSKCSNKKADAEKYFVTSTLMEYFNDEEDDEEAEEEIQLSDTVEA